MGVDHGRRDHEIRKELLPLGGKGSAPSAGEAQGSCRRVLPQWPPNGPRSVPVLGISKAKWLASLYPNWYEYCNSNQKGGPRPASARRRILKSRFIPSRLRTVDWSHSIVEHKLLAPGHLSVHFFQKALGLLGL